MCRLTRRWLERRGRRDVALRNVRQLTENCESPLYPISGSANALHILGLPVNGVWQARRHLAAILANVVAVLALRSRKLSGICSALL